MTARILWFPGAAVVVSQSLDGWRVTTPTGRVWVHALRSNAVKQATSLAEALGVTIREARP